MTNPEGILQLARLAGRAEFYQQMDLPDGVLPGALDPDQKERLRVLIEARLEQVATSLLQEAMACDDVHDATSANAYLEERLAFLGGLLTESQATRIRLRLTARTSTWR